jgi:hypothetical protein
MKPQQLTAEEFVAMVRFMATRRVSRKTTALLLPFPKPGCLTGLPGKEVRLDRREIDGKTHWVYSGEVIL